MKPETELNSLNGAAIVSDDRGTENVTEKLRKVGQSSIARRIVRSELNLEKNAVFTVSTYKEKSRETVIETEGPSS